MLTSQLYPNCKVYGPYIDKKTGRKRVFIRYILTDKLLTTIMYSRFLMQEKIGRLLGDDEEVDHVDEDKTNDTIENLLLMDREEHRKMHNAISSQLYNFKCHRCEKDLILTRRQYTNMLLRQRSGPFCSRRCSGLYGKLFQ